MYKLDFSGDEVQAKKRYLMCYEAIVGQPDRPPHDKWDTIMDLTKKLKKIGNEQPDKIPTATGRITLYELDIDGERVVFLEKAEYKQLHTFVKSPIWPNHALEDAQSLLDWLDAIKSDGGSLNSDAKPEAKRKGEATVAGSIEPKKEDA